MCNNPVKDIQEAKARLVALFGDLETYMEFLVSDTLLKHGCLCEAYTKRSLHEIKS